MSDRLLVYAVLSCAAALLVIALCLCTYVVVSYLV